LLEIYTIHDFQEILMTYTKFQYTWSCFEGISD